MPPKKPRILAGQKPEKKKKQPSRTRRVISSVGRGGAAVAGGAILGVGAANIPEIRTSVREGMETHRIESKSREALDRGIETKQRAVNIALRAERTARVKAADTLNETLLRLRSEHREASQAARKQFDEAVKKARSEYRDVQMVYDAAVKARTKNVIQETRVILSEMERLWGRKTLIGAVAGGTLAGGLVAGGMAFKRRRARRGTARKTTRKKAARKKSARKSGRENEARKKRFRWLRRRTQDFVP